MTGDAFPMQAVGVHFSYGMQPVLRGVDLQVVHGEMLGLVGPNGAGKTTLLNLLGGTLKPGQGEVLVNGTNLHELRPKERARLIATVPQNPSMPHGFTALDMVLMGRNPHLRLLQWEGTKDVDVARRCLAMTGTDDLADRFVTSLSGGERQRVVIARALAQEAPLLLLDEPTAHLDLGYQASVLDVIEDVRRKARITVVAAIHDLTLAAQYCDRLAVLREGDISALGRAEDILTPDLVSWAFGAEVCVVQHPIFGTPVILHGRRRVLGNKQAEDSTQLPLRNGKGI